MFLQRHLYQRNYNYSHPLAGTLYNNAQFLNQCSSFLDADIKLSTTTTEDCEIRNPSRKLTMQGFHTPLKDKTPRQVHSANIQSSSTQRPGHKQGQYLSHTHLTDRPNLTAAFSRDSRQLPHRRVSLTESKGNQQRGSKTSHRRTLKRKLAINPFVDGYLFPNIEIRIIHKITSVSGIPTQTISFNFERIFKRLIRTQVMGEFTSNFMFKMEQFIRQIVSKEEMYENPLDIELEQSIKSLSRKEELLDVIFVLEAEGNRAKAQEVVKYYCIPSQEVSQRIYRQLMEQIVIEIYEKKNCCKDIEYSLLTENGNPIRHISEIFFSTRVLLLAPERSYEHDFEKYQKMLDEHDKQQRMTFKESVKHNFINKIVRQQVEEKLINYSKEPKEHQNYRKSIIEQAESLVVSKSKLRLQKNRPSPEKELTPEDLKFEEPAFTRQTLYNSYTHRKFQEKREYKDIIRKLQLILDPGQDLRIKSKLDERTEEEFRKLHRLNEEYDITYLHNPDNSNKLLLENLLKNCHLFSSKSDSQLTKIIGMLNKLYAKQKQPLKEIQFWQFKEIFETAHGLAQPKIIMKFVLTYLDFDEWGEISKKTMFKILEEAIPVKGRPLQLIRSIVWNWLQRCKLVENGALRKRNIEIWYQPVKVVYLLFLSIIFGTQYSSFEEMLTEMFKYQFY